MLFPAPLGPNTPSCCPASTSRSTPRSTASPPRTTSSPLASSTRRADGAPLNHTELPFTAARRYREAAAVGGATAENLSRIAIALDDAGKREAADALYVKALAAAENDDTFDPTETATRSDRLIRKLNATREPMPPGVELAAPVKGYNKPANALARADALLESDRFEDAIDAYWVALRVGADRPLAAYGLGTAYAVVGDVSRAREHLEAFLEAADRDPKKYTAEKIDAARETLASLAE